MNRNVNQKGILQIAGMIKNIYKEEIHSKRVWMGYLLGGAIVAYLARNFILYIQDTGEVVNVLEGFILIEHERKYLLLLLLGWLVIISDAPFIRGNAYYSLYRTNKNRWNISMLLYILSHGLLYVLSMAGITVVISSFWGYIGKIWSSPVYALVKGGGQDLTSKYMVSFRYEEMMREMTVPQAFGTTCLYLYLYLILLGVLLYVCNLILKEVYGIAIVMAVHISGYLLGEWQMIEQSLLARAIPGNFIGGMENDWSSVYIFLGLVLMLFVCSMWMIHQVDIKEETEEEV
ncbi:MAG: hypothetical protein K2N51_06170 [Lachnospiraceae bacterium]|nr:hypothetical protein [Lachnospiraceae bacterium]